MADTLIFADLFTGESGNLQDHSPDTGTSWAKVEDTDGDLNFVLSANHVQASKDVVSDRCVYAATPASAIAGMACDFKIIQRAIASTAGDDPVGMMLRYQDISNYYSALIFGATSGNTLSVRIIKKVAGTVTALKTFSITVNDGDVFRFQIIGSSYKLFQNNTELTDFAGTDAGISAAGNGGIWIGNARAATDDVNILWQIDDFHVYETDGFVPPAEVTDVDPVEHAHEAALVAVLAAIQGSEHMQEADQAAVLAAIQSSEHIQEAGHTAVTIAPYDSEHLQEASAPGVTVQPAAAEQLHESGSAGVTATVVISEHAQEADTARSGEIAVADAEQGQEATPAAVTIAPGVAEHAHEADEAEALLADPVQDSEHAHEAYTVAVTAAVSSAEHAHESDEVQGLIEIDILMPVTAVINDMKTQAGIKELGTSASYESKSYGAFLKGTNTIPEVKETATWQSY